MGKHLQRDLAQLERQIVAMGDMVESATSNAIAGLIERSRERAMRVLGGDNAIDAFENEIEDHVLKTLALHTPVAGDLRFVVSVLKVNHDLERMGDLACNMAERIIDLLDREPLPVELPIGDMAEQVRSMIRETLSALVKRDADAARTVIREDDAVDTFHRQMFDVLQQVIRADPSTVESAIGMLSVSRQLERLADHCTNIAEDIVFQIEGEVIRHSH
ncbi:MAG: phosphate signaling complex protein PhoU [bacterium]|nr:phosphate signaling complex protein PhoU [bacterium]